MSISLTSYQTKKNIDFATAEINFASTIDNRITEVNILVFEYVLYGEERTEYQLVSILEALTSDIAEHTQNEEVIETSAELKDQNIDRLLTLQFNDVKRLFLKLRDINREKTLIQEKGGSKNQLERLDELSQIISTNLFLKTQEASILSSKLTEINNVQIDNSLEKFFQIFRWLLILFLVVIGLTTVTLKKSVTTPLKKLVYGTEIIGLGNLDHKLEVKSDNEISYIGNAINKMVISIKSITTSKDKLEKEVIERKKILKEFENIFNLSPDMVGVFTTDGKLIKVNPSWEKILGYTQEELVKVGWNNLVHPNDVEKTNKAVEKQLKGNTIVNFVNRYRSKDGQYRTLEWQASFAMEGIVHATARDITKRKKAERSLINAYNKLKTLDQMKSRLIANVSHELRTPLTIARASMDLAKKEDNSQERKELLDMGWAALEQQNKVIGNLIAAAKLDEKIELKKVAIDLRDVLTSSADKFTVLLENRDIKFKLDIDDKLPSVYADYESLRHVISNLLDNAIKFTSRKGMVTVKASKKKDLVEVSVKDTGKGMSKEEQKHIFNRFYQGDEIRYKGTGIGLAVVNELVEAHAGKMNVKSKIGKGSTFYFTLPVAKKEGKKK